MTYCLLMQAKHVLLKATPFQKYNQCQIVTASSSQLVDKPDGKNDKSDLPNPGQVAFGGSSALVDSRLVAGHQLIGGQLR